MLSRLIPSGPSLSRWHNGDVAFFSGANGPQGDLGWSRISVMSPISKVDGASVAGFLPEEHGEGETKPGDQRIARQLVTYLKNLYLRRRFVDLDLARHGIDDPDLPGPRVEVFLDLARHLVGRVALADHLDGQVGDHVPGLGPGNAFANGPTPGRNEGEVGTTFEFRRILEEEEHFLDDATEVGFIHERGKPAHQARGQENFQCTDRRLLHNATVDDLEEINSFQRRGLCYQIGHG